MNEIAKLIKSYDKLIDDLDCLVNDVYELIKDKYEYKAKKSNFKDLRNNWYTMTNYGKEEVFYICYNIEDDCPFLLLERIYDLKNTTVEDFKYSDVFDKDCEQSNDFKIKNLKVREDGIYSLSAEWGNNGKYGIAKVLYAKISLLEITSQEIVQTEIKSVIDCLLGVNNKLSPKTIKLI